jgi:hypothetical protein
MLLKLWVRSVIQMSLTIMTCQTLNVHKLSKHLKPDDRLWKDQPFRFDWEADLPKGRITLEPTLEAETRLTRWDIVL